MRSLLNKLLRVLLVGLYLIEQFELGSAQSQTIGGQPFYHTDLGTDEFNYNVTHSAANSHQKSMRKRFLYMQNHQIQNTPPIVTTEEVEAEEYFDYGRSPVTSDESKFNIPAGAVTTNTPRQLQTSPPLGQPQIQSLSLSVDYTTMNLTVNSQNFDGYLYIGLDALNISLPGFSQFINGFNGNNFPLVYFNKFDLFQNTEFILSYYGLSDSQDYMLYFQVTSQEPYTSSQKSNIRQIQFKIMKKYDIPEMRACVVVWNIFCAASLLLLLLLV